MAKMPKGAPYPKGAQYFSVSFSKGNGRKDAPRQTSRIKRCQLVDVECASRGGWFIQFKTSRKMYQCVGSVEFGGSINVVDGNFLGYVSQEVIKNLLWQAKYEGYF